MGWFFAMLLVLLAVVGMALLLSKISCPFCKGKNIAPKQEAREHGFGMKWDCLDCKKDFNVFPSICRRSEKSQ